jgi:aminopeptidase N
MVDFMLRKRKGIQNKLPIVGPENENYWAFGDSYNKGAWVLHTMRHVIDDDVLWWNIIKSFAVEHAKSNVNTGDFKNWVESKTDQNYQYFVDQYFYDYRTPTLEYYQKDDQLYFKWTNVIPTFRMPFDIELNGTSKRIYPTQKAQSIQIRPYSVVHYKDWQFLVNMKENPALGR